jgi:preprotein translocase subunit SecG
MSTLMQTRWRTWLTVAIVIALVIGVVLLISYSGDGSGGSGY